MNLILLSTRTWTKFWLLPFIIFLMSRLKNNYLLSFNLMSVPGLQFSGCFNLMNKSELPVLQAWWLLSTLVQVMQWTHLNTATGLCLSQVGSLLSITQCTKGRGEGKTQWAGKRGEWRSGLSLGNQDPFRMADLCSSQDFFFLSFLVSLLYYSNTHLWKMFLKRQCLWVWWFGDG